MTDQELTRYHELRTNPVRTHSEQRELDDLAKQSELERELERTPTEVYDDEASSPTEAKGSPTEAGGGPLLSPGQLTPAPPLKEAITHEPDKETATTIEGTKVREGDIVPIDLNDLESYEEHEKNTEEKYEKNTAEEYVNMR